MFPSYTETDFGEFKPPTLEQKTKTQTIDIKNKPNLLISPEDMSLVYEWHSNFVRNMTAAEWLRSSKKVLSSDVVKPLMQRYPTFSRVMQNAWEALDADFEGAMSPSLLVLISRIKENVEGTGKYLDISTV